jgi:3',5'-cyclic AMP phosphodiesterase CpdA
MLVAILAAAAANAAPVEVYAAGDIADCRNLPASESVAARTARLIPPGSLVLMLGDAVYGSATAGTYAECYGPTWGVHRATTLAVPGNHDYRDGRIAAFHAYFADGSGADGYFSRRLGGWLLIGLDSLKSDEGLDQQYAWLEVTLARHRDAPCTLAIWHEPMFASGRRGGSGVHMKRFWSLLERHGAEVVLNGHEHFYESFDPRDADGAPAAAGIREFVVGTGGARLYRLWSTQAASRAQVRRHGVLHLTLDTDRYAWEFIDVDGQVADAGSAHCHGPGGASHARQ